jgi:hypothetical protein
LDTYKDSLYSAGRAVTRTATAAQGSDISTHVGSEVDLLLTYNVCTPVNVQLGYSHFFAGEYLEKTGANDDGNYVYMQTTLSF